MAHLDIAKEKIMDHSGLRRALSRWRFKDCKIVFTNGCFDILHQGHLSLLMRAADFGDRLIVGLNTDGSVRKLKGEGRPVNNQESRSLMLAGLSCVDAVALFDDETPHELIKMVKPDILVKGADYSRDEIVGADVVEEIGGKVEIVELVEGFSTSDIKRMSFSESLG